MGMAGVEPALDVAAKDLIDAYTGLSARSGLSCSINSAKRMERNVIKLP
jgi:hypothetical protein